MKYRTILADPPWKMSLVHSRKDSRPGRKPRKPDPLPYNTLTIDEICHLPVPRLADDGCHLWLWTTNQRLHDAFHVMEAWGFKYLAPITWIKPSGLGHWFVHRTQTILFGYKGFCEFATRHRPNVLFASALRHSQKPECSYELIESVSHAPRLELFSRNSRPGWHHWGNEVVSDIDIFAEGIADEQKRA